MTVGKYNASGISLADGGQAQVQLDSSGNLKVATTGGASESHIGEVGTPVDIITVTPTVLNADAYDAGDVVFDTTAITDAVRVNGGRALLQSLVVADKDDQKAQLRLVFLDSDVTLGTADAAPSISDANALKVLGTVEVLAADYVDLGGASVATLRSIGLLLEAASDARDIYVAAFTSGTPTYTTGGLQLRFGLLQS